MEKQTSTNPTSNDNVAPPLGSGTSTSSGVTVFDTNSNQILPPTYEQAMSNTAPFATTTRTFTTTNGWNGPGTGAQNTGYNIPTVHATTTTYTTYGPPPAQPQPPRNPAQHTTFVQPPVVIIQEHPIFVLGPGPVYLTCPACHVKKLTRIEHEPSSRTHLLAALLCLVGLWFCVCLPYCGGTCMNTHHYCGNCGKFLGTYDSNV